MLKRPRLVLRVAFAGSQHMLTEADIKKLPETQCQSTLDERSSQRDEADSLRALLPNLLSTLGRSRANIHPKYKVDDVEPRPIAAFYDQDVCPKLRLISGLCQGADAIASRVIQEQNTLTQQVSTASGAVPSIETDLSAILPFQLR